MNIIFLARAKESDCHML